jgi:hypothetical protein
MSIPEDLGASKVDVIGRSEEPSSVPRVGEWIRTTALRSTEYKRYTGEAQTVLSLRDQRHLATGRVSASLH